MDVPRRPGDVLAQPTRARLFEMLGELGRPAPTEELAAELRLHPNGVRLHLERLREAGLVVRGRDRQARGRPRDMWSIASDARPGGEPPSAYADLVRWLIRLVSQRRTSLRTVEATGREIGRELAPEGDGSAERAMFDALVAQGFAPARELGPEGMLTYRLRNCPYRAAVHENQPIVCMLHRGITRGLLDALAPETTLAGFVPRDPDAAGCLIELRGRLAAEARTAASATPAP
ncbi:MAG TPA: helix-turn-helix domain-containing protein [Solirubrobacteraceae bacterium]|nr:helix-turn-helix domain-containing protein [Solirubrobacteraceae bacterium]